jgi:flagellar basal-body rod modification protein FlgD
MLTGTQNVSSGSLFGESAATAAAAAPSSTMGKEEFLTLLIEQLKNQDPLNPMESTDFTAQLAQFSSLEQLFNVNENIAALHEYAATMNRLTALDMIGKEVEYAGAGDVTLGAEGGATIKYNLADNANQVTVYINDAAGMPVTHIDVGSQESGIKEVTWNGVDSEGKRLPAGIYTFEVAAVDEQANSVAVDTFGSSTATGIVTDPDSGQTLVVTNAGRIPIDQVVGVRD